MKKWRNMEYQTRGLWETLKILAVKKVFPTSDARLPVRDAFQPFSALWKGLALRRIIVENSMKKWRNMEYQTRGLWETLKILAVKKVFPTSDARLPVREAFQPFSALWKGLALRRIIVENSMKKWRNMEYQTRGLWETLKILAVKKLFPTSDARLSVQDVFQSLSALVERPSFAKDNC